MRTIKAIILFVALAVAGIAQAQEAPYKFDVGAGLGMSGYAGDASSSVFKHPGFVGEVGARYIPNARMAFRAVFSTLSLSGNTADMSNVLPEGKQYSFSSQVYDLGARYEFNFFSYGIGETYKRMRRWTPYLTLGVGMTLAACDGNNAFGVNLPMGAGIKYKLKERLNLGLEFTMTKVFNDHVDGRDLCDLTTIKSSFVKNNDWYSRFTIGITYEFGKRCETCHYVE
jgi:predicted porin